MPRTRARRPSLGVERLENRTTPALIGLEAADLPVSVTGGVDGGGDLAVRADGTGFVVTYESPDAQGGGIFFKRYDANWQLVQGPVAVNTTTVNDQQIPSIGIDAAGNFVIAWQSFGQDGDTAVQGNIYARRFLADGTAVDAAEFRVNTTTTGQQRDPDVAVNAAGQFVVAFRSGVSAASILAQSYSGITAGGSGTPTTVGGEVVVKDGSVFPSTVPAVAIDSAGNYVVTYQAFGQDAVTSDFGIFLRRMSQSGTPLASEFLVNVTTAGNQQFPDIATDGSGNFNVAWYSDNVDGSGTAVVMRRFNSLGQTFGGEIQVNTGITTNNQINPHIAATAGGLFLVTWTGEEADVDATGTDVYFKLYNSSGGVVVGDTAVSPTTASNDAGEDNAVGGINSAGDFVVLFDSGAGGTFDTFLRRFAEDADVAFSAASSSGAESANASVGLTRTGAAYVLANVSTTVTVNVAGGGTATAGTDFTTTFPTSVTFPANGSASQNLTITITDDADDEADETINLTIGGVTNGTATGQTTHTYTILDNDLPPATLAINDVTLVEGDAGTTTFSFTVSLTAPAGPGGVTFDITTADGTATAAGGDYVAQALTGQTIPAGSSTYVFAVAVNGDTRNEATEVFFVNITNVTGAVVTDGQGVGAITNDDPVPAVSVGDVTQAEGDSGTTAYTFTVILSAASGQTVTVNYATADGTALVGSDYTAAAGILTFAPGVTTQTVTVLVTGDDTFEADETFLVNLSGPTNATIADGQAVGTITNDDPVPAVTLSLTGSPLAETGGVATVTATLSNPSSLPVVVTLGLTGTAAGADYTASGTVITIPAGSLTGSVTLTGVDDTADEADETVIADVTAVTGGTESGAQQVTATVTDDDLPVAVADARTTNEDAPLTAPSVLGNDNAAPGSTAELVGAGPSNGTLTLNTDGTFDYAPAADFNGTDSFQYRVRNTANELSAPVTVTLTVTAVNDAPAFTAGPGQTVGRGGDPITVPGWATGVSAGPADESGQALTFVVTTDNDALFAVLPAIDPATGTLTFTPTATGFGTATVTVRPTDDGGGANASAPQTFTITVTRHATGDDTAVDQTEFPTFAVGAGPGGPGTATAYNPDGSVASTATPFGPGVGVRAVLADVTGDGVADVVAGTAPGVPARVLVTDPATGRTVLSAFPFGADFTGGVYVAAGDVNADGQADVVVSADATGGARVVVYDGATGAVVASFLGIDDAAFRGGARVAVGDVNGDGISDVVVTAGLGGGPRVAVFDGTTIRAGSAPRRLIGDFFAFEQTLRDGAFVAVGDLNGDGFGDLVFGGGPGGAPRVLAFDGRALFGPAADAGRFVTLTSFFAADSALRPGVQVAVKDADGDRFGDLLTAVVTPTQSEVKLILGKDLTPTGGAATTDLDLFPGLTSGVFVG